MGNLLLVLIGILTARHFMQAVRRPPHRLPTAYTPPEPGPNTSAGKSGAGAGPSPSRRRRAGPAAAAWGAARRAPAVVERHFCESWPVPAQARMAARLFNGAVALACAGILVALAAAVPAGVAPRPLAGGVLDAAAGDIPGVAAVGAALAPSLVSGDSDPGSPPHAPAADPAAPPLRGALPVGKGMWLYLPDQVEGGDPHAIAARANQVGLTHLYVRTGSSRAGFYAQEFLDRLLPVAHAAGLRVYGWDFPYFDSWSADVFRALEAIRYTTPDGHRIDGFSADIETPSEGTKISAHHATEYGSALRAFVGPDYPLIATIPRPSRALIAGGYPFAEIVASFDAVAPMVYWMNREPGADVAGAIDFLSAFGKPVIPVGQVYDGAPEGGPRGVPPRGQIIRFMQVAEEKGAIGVSFWSWQHADQQAWDAIADAAEFRLVAAPPAHLTAGMVRAYQGLLSSLGFPTAITGAWDDTTAAAVVAYQRAAGLPVTATVDERTRASMLSPFPAPVRGR